MSVQTCVAAAVTHSTHGCYGYLATTKLKKVIIWYPFDQTFCWCINSYCCTLWSVAEIESNHEYSTAVQNRYSLGHNDNCQQFEVELSSCTVCLYSPERLSSWSSVYFFVCMLCALSCRQRTTSCVLYLPRYTTDVAYSRRSQPTLSLRFLGIDEELLCVDGRIEIIPLALSSFGPIDCFVQFRSGPTFSEPLQSG